MYNKHFSDIYKNLKKIMQYKKFEKGKNPITLLFLLPPYK